MISVRPAIGSKVSITKSGHVFETQRKPETSGGFSNVEIIPTTLDAGNSNVVQKFEISKAGGARRVTAKRAMGDFITSDKNSIRTILNFTIPYHHCLRRNISRRFGIAINVQATLRRGLRGSLCLMWICKNLNTAHKLAYLIMSKKSGQEIRDSYNGDEFIFLCSTMIENQKIEVLGLIVQIKKIEENDFISLTDIAKRKNTTEPKDVVRNRLRLHNTIEYLGLREFVNNPNFNSVEFDAFKNEAGTNAFTLSPMQWIEKTHAIGLISRSGKYGGGTYAHKDIALKFASWISIEFELYLIKEFQRLKEQEFKNLNRNTKRFLTKMNYKIHTDAIKENLIPQELSPEQINAIYADEADVLNIALFGKTAKQWRDSNLGKKGNIRDEANIQQLIILANIESINAEYIKFQIPQNKRLQLLNQTAITQMKSLVGIGVPNKLVDKKADKKSI